MKFLPILVGLLFWTVAIIFVVRRYRGRASPWRVSGRDARTPAQRLADECEAIAFEIRSGYEAENDIMARASEVRIAGAEVSAVVNYASQALEAHRREQADWPVRTKNDALSAAFEELTESGILALEKVGFTMSEAWEIVCEEAEARAPRTWLGACFFHEQDVMEAVEEGHGLHLAFGPVIPVPDAQHEAVCREIATKICETLRRHALACTWTGNIDDRILIEPFVWQRRYRPSPQA